MTDIPVLQLDPELPIPTRARPSDAGLDLLARCDVVLEAGGGRALVPTGLALELPDGWAGLVLPRSGLAIRHGVTCLNAPGLIDPGYRGEVGVILVNTDPTERYEVHRGDRVAQLLVVRFEAVALVSSGMLAESERGEGGFGHTGR
ncbi:MAG: dUTP diphosphatase [Acidimicrobiales bacterium]